jgi:hypothetical protein
MFVGCCDVVVVLLVGDVLVLGSVDHVLQLAMVGRLSVGYILMIDIIVVR